MLILFIIISLLTITFYGKIFFTEKTREEARENKRKMKFYNRRNIKTEPAIKDYKTTYNS